MNGYKAINKPNLVKKVTFKISYSFYTSNIITGFSALFSWAE